MNPHVYVMGCSARKYVHVICNEEGLEQLPNPTVVYRDGGGGLPIGARIALTKANIVAMRLMNAMSARDAAFLLERCIPEDPAP